MRVICCYTRVRQSGRSSFHPLTEAALKRYAPQTEWIDVSGSADAYARSLCRLWTEGDGFLNVEHDIEINAQTIRQAVYCPQLWCIWPYLGPGFQHHNLPAQDAFLYRSLGCVRFHRKLLLAEPDLMLKATGISHGEEFRPAHWIRMDAEVSPLLLGRGYQPHIHWPQVIHHHLYEPYGCACGGQHE